MTVEERTQTVATGTNVVFEWSGSHNVWLMSDKAAYDACDFSQANELASASVQDYTYKASEAGTVYFACEFIGHCAFASQKLALTVN